MSSPDVQPASSDPQSVTTPVKTFPELKTGVHDEATEQPAKRCGCSDPRKWDRKSWSKFILFLVLVGIILFVIVDAVTTGHVGEGFNIFLEWFREQPTAGTFAFILLYIVATVAFIPGSILTLGAGFIFSQAFGQGIGIAAGTGVVFVGASVGATLAFLVGRYVLREWVAELIQKYRIMRAVDAAIKEKGAVLVLLLRLSPVVPFSAFNYIMSATSVSLRDYLLGFVGMIPGTAAFVYFGSLLSSVRDAAEGSSGAEDQNPALRWSLLGVGLLATVAALVFISIYAKRALNAALLKEEAKDAEREAASSGGDVELGLASAPPTAGSLSATEVIVTPQNTTGDVSTDGDK